MPITLDRHESFQIWSSVNRDKWCKQRQSLYGTSQKKTTEFRTNYYMNSPRVILKAIIIIARQYSAPTDAISTSAPTDSVDPLAIARFKESVKRPRFFCKLYWSVPTQIFLIRSFRWFLDPSRKKLLRAQCSSSARSVAQRVFMSDYVRALTRVIERVYMSG